MFCEVVASVDARLEGELRVTSTEGTPGGVGPRGVAAAAGLGLGPGLGLLLATTDLLLGLLGDLALNGLADLLPVTGKLVDLVILLNLLGAEAGNGHPDVLLGPVLLSGLNILPDPLVLGLPVDTEEPLGPADLPDLLLKELVTLLLDDLLLIEVIEGHVLLLELVRRLDITNPDLGEMLVTLVGVLVVEFVGHNASLLLSHKKIFKIISAITRSPVLVKSAS